MGRKRFPLIQFATTACPFVEKGTGSHLLVTALSQVMAKIPMAVLAGVMVIVAVKTFSWHSIRPGELARNPWPETLVMLVTVAATVGTSNLAIGVLAGIVAMAIIPRRLRAKAQATLETASPDPEK